MSAPGSDGRTVLPPRGGGGAGQPPRGGGGAGQPPKGGGGAGQPPKGGGRSIDAGPYDRAAEPVLAMAAQLEAIRGVDVALLLRRAADALERFDNDLLRGGALASTVPPARYALALILDHKARANRAVDVQAWAAGAHRMLFDGRDMSLASLRDFIRRADGAGADFAPVALFLTRCLGLLEEERTRFQGRRSSGWGGMVAVLVAAFLLAVAGWAGFVEWRFHRDLNAVFAGLALDTGLDRAGPFPDLAGRLDRMGQAAAQVELSATKAPIHLFARPLGFDAAHRAAGAYDAAVQTHLPAALAATIGAALAQEGESLPMYDTLRAWSVLSGQSDWSPAYLQGWLADRAVLLPEAQGLGRHIARLDRLTVAPPLPDPELLDQARTFAAEAPEEGRAYLELVRSDAAAGLPPWRGDDAVPGLSDVLQRRSGTPMAQPIAGIFTAHGWDHARDSGAGLAVQKARAEASALFSAPLPQKNDAPDRVMVQLETAQLAVWKAYLADLQVRPFADTAQAVLVSGRLSLPDSPLEGLMKAVWAEAGGLDRRRPHDQQIRVAAEFSEIIQYVEQGRMADIASLFAALNVALGTMDKDEARGLQRLMSVQDRAASVKALRRAPRVVEQIVEDVLAQTSSSQSEGLTNPLTQAWQRGVLDLCKRVEGRFPFGDGPDVVMADVAALLAPGAAIDGFYQGKAAQFIDTGVSPWRWKPDARFTGLAPESAAFLQRAQAITAGLFGGDAATRMTLTALAERGTAFVALGGTGGPVETTKDPLVLDWPGPDPGQGVDISFTTATGEARITQPGEWGFLRVMAGLRLRERDGGKRFLIDLKSQNARLFVELGFAGPDNPLSRLKVMQGFACPTAL